MSERRRAPRGFTLLEVLVALVVTAMVVTLAYGAARAGLDTEARLTERRTADEATIAWRTLLGDAVRHVDRGVAETDAVFELRGPARGGADTLRLISRGVVAPLGTGARWLVQAAPTPDGVLLVASPVADAAQPPVRVLVREARGLDVSVLAYAGGTWTRGWSRTAAAPAAVAVRLVDARGAALGPALVARTRPAGEPEEAP